MILRTQRSFLALCVDRTLTILAWLGFCYLIAGGVAAVLLEGPDAGPSEAWARLLPTLDTLLAYVAGALVASAMLVGWARYNRMRYGRLCRRAAGGELHDWHCLLAFCASPAQLKQLQECPLGIVHHDPDGLVSAVEAPGARLVLVSDAA